MEVYTTEEEQVAALKKWWKENWMSLFGGALIGVAILVGGKYWKDSRDAHHEAASAEFEMLMQFLSTDKLDEASDKGAVLLGQYSDTPYAGMASLAMAKIKLEKADLVAATSHLRWAIENVEQPEIKNEATIRLARVYLADNKLDDALDVLNKMNPGPFKAMVEELKGDIYVAKGEEAKARTAYTVALAAIDTATENQNPRARNFLQMKLDDLGQAEIPSGDS